MVNNRASRPAGATGDESTRSSAVVAPRIAHAGELIADHAVIVDDGRIADVVPVTALPDTLPTTILPTGILAPGLIDVHGHGAHGHSANDASREAIKAVAAGMLTAGVTTWLPTFASAPVDDLVRGLGAVRELRGATGVADMPGAHLEGPYFAAAQRGAQSLGDLRPLDDGSPDVLLDHADAIRMISFAPELPGALAFTRRLVAAGIVAAAGHTDGTAAHLHAAQDAGLSHVIHIYSGQSVTRRDGPWRVPGMLEATLASDHLTVEMIADGKHLPPELMTIAHRALRGRLCLVSDATSGAGLDDGQEYFMGAGTYVVENGVGVTPDRTSFGGSTTLLPAMLPIARDVLGIDEGEAIRMATEIPARAARLGDRGSIAAGLRADFTHLSDELDVLGAAVAGQWHATSAR